MAERGGFEFVKRIVRTDGAVRLVRSRGRAHVDAAGDVVEIVGVFQDVTEIQRREQALEQLNTELLDRMPALEKRNAQLSLLSEMTDLLQCAVSTDEIAEVLELLLPRMFAGLSGAVYGFSPGSRAGGVVLARWGETAQPELVDFQDCWGLRRGVPHRVRDGAGLRCRHHASRPRNAACHVLSAQGETIGLLVLESDEEAASTDLDDGFAGAIADQLAISMMSVRLRERLREGASRDALTALFNRRHLETTFEREILLAGQAEQPLAVAIIDVDRFKAFNDTHGHHAGDHALRIVAGVLQECARQTDTVCRWGGEEFLLLMPGATAEGAVEVLHRVRAALAQIPLGAPGERPATLTISSGVAAYPPHGATLSTLGRAADRALYAAKRAGRDRVLTVDEVESGPDRIALVGGAQG